MDPYRANQRKWDNFLSTIKTEKKKEHTPSISITQRKDGVKCLAYNLAHQLLADSNSIVTVTGQKEHVSAIQNRTDLLETYVPVIPKSRSFPISGPSWFTPGSTISGMQIQHTSKTHGSTKVSRSYGQKRNVVEDDEIEETKAQPKHAKYIKHSMDNGNARNQHFNLENDGDLQLSSGDSLRHKFPKVDANVDFHESIDPDDDIEPFDPNKSTDVVTSKHNEHTKEIIKHEHNTDFHIPMDDMQLLSDRAVEMTREERNHTESQSYKDFSVNEITKANVVNRQAEIIDVDLIKDNEMEDEDFIDETNLEEKDLIMEDVIKNENDMKHQDEVEKGKDEDEVRHLFHRKNNESRGHTNVNKESDFRAQDETEREKTVGRHDKGDDTFILGPLHTHGYYPSGSVIYKRDEEKLKQDFIKEKTIQEEYMEEQVEHNSSGEGGNGAKKSILDNYASKNEDPIMDIFDMRKMTDAEDQTLDDNTGEGQDNDCIEIKDEDELTENGSRGPSLNMFNMGVKREMGKKKSNGTDRPVINVESQGKDTVDNENNEAEIITNEHETNARGPLINMFEMRNKTETGEPKSNGIFRKMVNVQSPGKGTFKIKDEDEVTEVVPHLTSKMSAESVQDIPGDINIQRKRERNKPSPRKVKPDIEIPCSRWTMVLFSKYFNFDSTVSRLSVPVGPANQECISVQQQISKEVKKRCEIMFDNNTTEATKDFFKDMRSNEITVRILIDAIFLTLCSSLGYNIEVGKNINSTILIPCEFDYRILHKGKVIGSIEAKSSEGLKKVSVIQAVLQLSVLQAEVIQSGVENIPPLFNIVTDGVRFIFIQLKGEKLGFEHNHLNKLHVNRVESIKDLEELIPKLVNLVKMSEDCAHTIKIDDDEVLDLT